jgi:Protein of unknown function (DUF4236)
MGLRFRRTVKIAPGLRFNVSRSGVSLTAGPRGASINFGAKGAFANVGIPGTGLSYRQQLGAGGAAAEPEAAPISPDAGTIAVAEVFVEAFKHSMWKLGDLWEVNQYLSESDGAAFFAQIIRKELFPRKRVVDCKDGVRRSITPGAIALAAASLRQELSDALSLPRDPLTDASDEIRTQALTHARALREQLGAMGAEVREEMLEAARAATEAAGSYAGAEPKMVEIVSLLRPQASGPEPAVAHYNEHIAPIVQKRLAWDLLGEVRSADEKAATTRIRSRGDKTLHDRENEAANQSVMKVVAAVIVIIIALIALANS